MQVRKVLYPFSMLYGLVTAVRNKLFDWAILPSEKYNIPVISIGNITVGGTGKTPFTEYLIRLLDKDYQLALLSRGYKRKTKGALLANDQSTAEDIGDEPFQIKNKFPKIGVVVAEKRIEGMQIIKNQGETDVVLMDDAYQHRYVTPGLSILVIDYNRPLWNDLPFPAGNLREPARGQARADIILVNKCPLNMELEEKKRWLGKIKPLPNQSVFFSGISYGGGMKNENESIALDDKPLLALAGIARPEPFFQYLKENFQVKKQMSFPDHHHFGSKDLNAVLEAFSGLREEGLIVTTEKDYTRLKGLNQEIDSRLVYIPIQLKILFEEDKSLEYIIRNYVRDYQKDS